MLEIKSSFDGKVIFSAEVASIKLAVELAVKSRADLSCANLSGANLSCANLSRADLDDKSKTVGGRPIFQLGPLGSRCAYLVAYLTDKGIRIRAGCFFGSLAEFRAKVKATHKAVAHGKEYVVSRASMSLGQTQEGRPVMELIEEMAEAIADRYCTKDAGIVRHNQSLPEARENARACLPVFDRWLREKAKERDKYKYIVHAQELRGRADELAAMAKEAKRGT